MSHKGEKRRSYTMEFKREAIEYAEKNSNHKAAEKFNVAVKRIREWRQNKLKIFEPTVKPNNKRLEGGGRKPLDLQLENQLVELNGFMTEDPMDFVSRGNLSWPRRNIFMKVNVMKVRNLFWWQAMSGSTISCVVMVFCYVVKQQQHSKTLNG